MTVQRDQQVGDSFLLNTSCGFNRVPRKGGPKLRFSTLQKKGLKVSTFRFLSFLLLTTASLSFRTSPFPFPIRTYSMVTIFFPNFSIVLVLLSNIPKLKFSILTDPTVFSILPLSISHLSGDQYFFPRTRGNTQVSFLTKNCHFTYILTTTLTKQYQWSNA